MAPRHIDLIKRQKERHRHDWLQLVRAAIFPLLPDVLLALLFEYGHSFDLITLRKGDYLDCLDRHGLPSLAQVIGFKNEETTLIGVTFVGWSSFFDEWIDIHSNPTKIAPPHTWAPFGLFPKKGDRVTVSNGPHRDMIAQIEEVGPAAYLVEVVLKSMSEQEIFCTVQMYIFCNALRATPCSEYHCACLRSV